MGKDICRRHRVRFCFEPPGSTPTYLDLRHFLEAHTAEDIKGIELNFLTKYTNPYEVVFPPEDSIKLQYAFIEITTRAGHGPFLNSTPGMYLYRPLPIRLAKAMFTNLKYSVTDTAKHLPDTSLNR